MKRKLLSLILVAAMLASMLVFAPTSGAAVDAGKAEVAVTDATVAAGDQVSVDVIVTTDKLQTFDLGFKYDATKLELVEWAKKGGAKLPAEVLGDFATTSGLSLNSNLGLVGFGASNANGVALDANDGLTIATITFNVKAGATPGDTYVEFSNAKGLYVRPNTSDTIDGDNLITKPGKITILPSGYDSLQQGKATDASYFTITDNGDGTCQIKTCSATGDVVIPEEIGGLTVTSIASYAFVTASVLKNTGVTSVLIPKTVTSLEDYALINLVGDEDALNTVIVTILNKDCEMGVASVAYRAELSTSGKGTSKKITGVKEDTLEVAYNTVMVGDEETYPNIVTVKYAKGGSVEEYLNVADQYDTLPDSVAFSTTLTYTVGEDVYVAAVGNSTTAPGSAVVNGEVIVAWNDGVNNIAPGASMTIAGDTTLAPVTIKAPVTDNGASVKPAASAADLAIRFTSKLAIADYEKLGEIGKVQLGMLITPQKYVDYATAFTKADLAAWVVSQGYQAKDAYVDVQVNSYLSMDANDYTIAASLKGFSTATTTNNPTFAAIAYAEITIGENVVTVYGSYDKACGRDAKSVLEAAHAEADGEIKTWISDLIDEFTK